MMRNKNKILILVSIIVMIASIGLFSRSSTAAYLGAYDSGLNNVKNKGASAVGSTVTANFSNLTSRNDVYCVMLHKSLRGPVNYRVARFIEITENTAINDKGQSYTSQYNGKLAYILSKRGGYGSGEGSYSTTQLALYRSINSWYANVGSKLGISNQWSKNNSAVGGDSLIAEANNYAKSLGNDSTSSSGATDKTDKSKIAVTAYSKDNTEYLRIGPFNWVFSGKLTSVKVYGDNEKIISNVKYSKFEGSTEKFYENANNIASGKDFYITIKADEGFTKIGDIIATTETANKDNIYKAKIWFLNATYMQNLILVDVDSEGQKVDSLETPFDYDITLVKDIELEKIDSVKKDVKLDKVGFILKNKDTGKYLKKSGSEYSFVNEKQKATEFITENGKIFIKSVPVATYVAYETSNENYGYEIPEKGTTIEIKDKTKKITNDYKLGKLRIEKVDKKYTDKKLKDVEFTLKAISGRYKGQYVGVDENKNAYYSESIVYIKTDDSGIIEINDIWEGNYTLTETKNPNYGYVIDEKNLNIEVSVKPYEMSKLQVTNEYKLGKISIEKVDLKYSDIKLKDVEFTLQALTGEYKGKYVAIDREGNALYVDEVAHIKTNDQGRLEIDKVWEGNYKLTEVNNPNYGYIIDENNKIIDLEIKPYETSKREIKNEQVYIKLSGFIWLDKQSSGKSTVRNDYYKTDNMPDNGYLDDQDVAFDGISVKLKRIDNDQIVKEGYSDRKEFTDKDQVTTSQERGLYSEIEGGEYVFEYVRIDELSNYYVEFEYDGLIYQSVVTHLDHNNGSKSTDKEERDILDKNFATVDSTGENKVNVNNGAYNITYNETQNYATSIKDSSDCILHAKTNDAKCYINNYFKPGQTEIRYINLGLFEKKQTDYALTKDLYDVRVDVNGLSHVYRYATARYNKDGSINENSSWNMGVKFQNNKGKYSRAIYKTDAEYEAPNHKDNEIKVYVTYKLAVKNESKYWGRINSIVDYYDNRYELINIGTMIDEKDNITGNINYREKTAHNDNYSKCIIDVNSIVNPGEVNYIYAQFELQREGILAIARDEGVANNGELLNNVAEINSYTTFKDNNLNTTLAVVDVDSVPGNIIPGNSDTYEDDTDAAKSLQLELKNARALVGTVFVDSTGKDSNTVYENQTRLGNGIFDNGESTVGGVKVSLHEIGKDDISYDGERIDMETTTNDNGEFEFVGYIPGNYIVTYTWGDKTYKVQYYKGTIYDQTRDQNNKFWYRDDNIDIRKTDALDSPAIREKIDNEMEAIKLNTIENEINKAYESNSDYIKTTKMDSTTPTMTFGVEYLTTVTDGTEDQVRFTVKNVDFGIVERAKQKLELTKRVSRFKITLANQQILVDAEVTEDGQLKGSHDHTTYIGPSNTSNINVNGIIRTEVDNELIQGATLEVTYTIKAKNIGELDYESDKYYYYGDANGSTPVKVSVTGLIDYVDGRLVLLDDKWEEKNKVFLNEVNASKKDDEAYINSIKPYLTSHLTRNLVPGESNTVTLHTSKLLTSTDDNTFDNKAEIVEVTKVDAFNSGTPVKVEWNAEKFNFDVDNAETAIIIPSTGENKAYVLPTIIGMTSLLVFGVGIFIIKKFVIINK